MSEQVQAHETVTDDPGLSAQPDDVVIALLLTAAEASCCDMHRAAFAQMGGFETFDAAVNSIIAELRSRGYFIIRLPNGDVGIAMTVGQANRINAMQQAVTFQA